ncbi:MAG: DUF2938 family protein [Gemmatimonadaceae bacterium]
MEAKILAAGRYAYTKPMDSYDPYDEPDPKAWLEIDEGERIIWGRARAGIHRARTPHPTQARVKSLTTHTVFGVGLYVSAPGVGFVLQ